MTITSAPVARHVAEPDVAEPDVAQADVAQRDLSQQDRARAARTTGLWYLAFFLTGVAGTILVRGRLFDADDPRRTLANLVEHASLARLGIALELGIVLTQALTAVSLYRLFRGTDANAAGTLALFGLANAIAILASAALLATALEVSGDASLTVAGGTAATVQLLYVTSGHVWGVAALFFGLWLIPMGRLVLRSGWMPRPLGWTLIVGGIGYTSSAFVTYAFADADAVAQLMMIPSIVGELWITALLLVTGVRRRPATRT